MAAGPGDVGRFVRVLRSVKTMHDQREWLKYLRREAVVRALNPQGNIVTEEIGEAADQICDILEQTEIPFEVATGIPSRVSRWTREKVTRGIRFPEYSGPHGQTFFERLARWVVQATESDRFVEALDRVSYLPGEEEQRRRLFAFAVAQEVRGLLSESRRPEGQNMVRYRMAASIFNGAPDRDIQSVHTKWRLFLQSLMAGVVAGLSAEFLFSSSWEDALGFGTTVAVGNAVREAMQGGVAYLSPDIHAFRRQITGWLKRLPDRIIRRVEWSDAELGETVMESEEPLRGILDALDRGKAFIGEGAEDAPDLVELDSLIRRAGEVQDLDARAFLIDAQTALLYETTDIPTAFTRLLLFLEGEGRGHGARRLPSPRPPFDPGRHTTTDNDLII